MIMNIPFVGNLQLISEHQQQLINTWLIAQNPKLISFDYQPGQEVLKIQYEPHKLEPWATGPYRINAAHMNGTITTQLMPYTIEHVTIQCVKPFKRCTKWYYPIQKVSTSCPQLNTLQLRLQP
jgi:hypothetical protein